MTLMAMKGKRAAFSVSEVAKECGLSRRALQKYIKQGLLYRASSDKYGILLKDANEFLMRLNNGSLRRTPRQHRRAS